MRTPILVQLPGQGSQFSEAELLQMHPAARMELRSKARGLVVLESMVRQLQGQQTFHPQSGVYLACGPGPAHARTQAELLQQSAEQRSACLDKMLPPKDYFIANPAMRAAQLSVDFQFHGPWTAFLHPQLGMAQACQAARDDLMDGLVEAALVAGLFMLDDPIESLTYQRMGADLQECVVCLYARCAQEIPDLPTVKGRWGALTAWVLRGQS